MTIAKNDPAPAVEPTTIVQALSAAMRQVLSVGKNDTNTAQHFSFRGIDAVLNALGPALRNQGVVPVPTVLHTDVQIMENSNGRKVRFGVIDVQYTFYGPGGDSITATVVGEAMDYGDKVVSKAMSVAFRTALIQVFALPTQEADPDSYSYDLNGDTTHDQPQPVVEPSPQTARTGPPKGNGTRRPDTITPATDNERKWLSRIDPATDELQLDTLEKLEASSGERLGSEHRITQYVARCREWAMGAAAEAAPS